MCGQLMICRTANVVSVLKALLIYLFWDYPNIIKRMLWYRLNITVKWWKLGLDWNDLWRTTLRQIHIWKKDLLLLEIFHVLKYVSIVHVEIQPKFYRGKGISTSMRMMFLLMIKIWHKAWLASFYICDFFLMHSYSLNLHTTTSGMIAFFTSN